MAAFIFTATKFRRVAKAQAVVILYGRTDARRDFEKDVVNIYGIWDFGR